MEEGKGQESINQEPYLAQDIVWESDNSTRKHHMQKSQEVCLVLLKQNKQVANQPPAKLQSI